MNNTGQSISLTLICVYSIQYHVYILWNIGIRLLAIYILASYEIV